MRSAQSRFGLRPLAALAIAVLSLSAHAGEKLPAFPGAEGFGTDSVGGRGGKVLKVTTLKSEGPGSLKWALEQKGPRIVVFDVSGAIKLSGKFYNPKLTIAGQTAPGAGITVDGCLTFCGSKSTVMEDLIVRFIRVRPTFRGWTSGGDCIRVGGSRNSEPDKRVVLDHCSVAWSTDEAIQFSAGGTMQWCACEGSDTGWEGHHHHNYGPYFYACKLPQTLHHSLIAHATERCPQQSGTPLLDMRNCVIYNCWPGVQLGNSNAVNNYLKAGPGGPQSMRPNMMPLRPARPGLSQARSGAVYASGNVIKPLRGAAQALAGKFDTKAEKPHEAPKVATQGAAEAYELVMAHAGCLPRDAVSKKVFMEARTGTGFMGRYEPEEGLMKGLTPGKAKPDADNDGMPDEWEKAHGLNPNDASDSGKIVPAGASKDDRHKGYTYVEFYVNDLADKLVAGAIAEYKAARAKEAGAKR